jgi:2-polyprenyl-3-methyl-5-hydroxy-6-metoxy-1,4-benzoquinol methylase/glycosyltransferase involved in cell wall biosynthesis
MKLAYFSPLNPQPSGISDYSEELLPYLAAHAEIGLFVDGFRPSNSNIANQFSCFDYHRDPSVLERLQDYDAVIYHMGNDHRYHAGIFETMQKQPGVVVFHDFALQDFFLGLARARGDMELYLAEVAACHGKNERIIAEEHLLRGSVPPQVAAPLNFPLNCRAASGAEGIVVHSQWSRARFEGLAPGVPVARIPMPVVDLRADRPGKTGSFVKDDNGQPGAVSIASFGLVTPDKGVELTLRVLSRLRDDYDFHFTLVGAENSYFDVREIISDCGMSDRVKITGQVTLAEFERYISETDVAINLRERTVGETSASLYRIMAASVPAIVSNVGAFAELPNDAVVKIDHDNYTDALLQAYLRKLIEDTQFRLRIGANARRHVLSEHDAQQSAVRYVDFIGEVIANRSRKQLIKKVSDEMSLLGMRANDDSLLRDVASEVALLAPVRAVATATSIRQTGRNADAPRDASGAHNTGNGRAGAPARRRDSHGRLPRIEGIDYKRAAVEYPSKLDSERSYYLRTKPFYNLKNKPVKHLGDGMDAETHRHFCDFANIAVALGLPAGGSILDVGCGSGWLSEYFSRLGYNVLGIDISDDLIQMARERVERVPYNVDHETSLHCGFLKHDVESAPLQQTFDAIICYDALHHFEDEAAVFSHLAAMLDVGGLLFILEGQKPSAGSATEDELREVMRNYGTLESPFSVDYLRTLLEENGFAVVGDYVSVNGLFEREMLEGNRLPLTTLATDYHYLTCKKVCDGMSASTVPDSRSPGLLRAQFSLRSTPPKQIAPGAAMAIPLAILNTGDTLWLAGQTVRAGIVMPAVRIFDDAGTLVSEFHGEPGLPSAVAPGETINIRIDFAAPRLPGFYTLKVDLVDQHVCWFEQHGSEPFLLRFEVGSGSS